MKILVVSVFSNHMFNWILQLKGAGHDIYWLDVNDANTYVKRIDFIQQTVKWKRKIEYPGRYWLKNHLPRLESTIEKVNQRKFLPVFKKKLAEIKPDVVQSFEMHSACVPIAAEMKKHPEIKWIYSAWGNDLYFYQNEPEKLKGIKEVFTRLDYMFADCTRDFHIAKKYGFNGIYLGTFPGGGGYEFSPINHYLKARQNRDIILIKGYEHKFGRAITLLKALLKVKNEVSNYRLVIFAATPPVMEYVKQSPFKQMKNLEVMGKIGRGEVLELIGRSLIYIGNSISDGMPNTLLEAIIMECFPIQSNPGEATAEVIQHQKNGLLIEEPENSDHIAALISFALNNREMLKSGIAYNTQHIKPTLEREYVKKQVLEKYKLIEESL